MHRQSGTPNKSGYTLLTMKALPITDISSLTAADFDLGDIYLLNREGAFLPGVMTISEETSVAADISAAKSVVSRKVRLVERKIGGLW